MQREWPQDVQSQNQLPEHNFSAIAHPTLIYHRRHSGKQETPDAAQTPLPSPVVPKSHISRITASGGKIFHFNFGAIVSINVPAAEIEDVLSEKSGALIRIEDGPSEQFQVYVDPEQNPSVAFNRLILDRFTPAREEVVALTLGQSAAMEYYEQLAGSLWHELEVMLARLRQKGTVSPAPGKLHRKIAEIIAARASVVGVLHMLDRPDLIWDDVVMDRLYDDLRATFDLQERFQALEYKLGLIQDTLEVLLDTARDRRSFWMEVIIVLFFAIEVFFTFLHEFPVIGRTFRAVFRL